MKMAPIQNRSMQKVINVDHSGRSSSPLPTRATGNYISTPTRCRLSAADTESIRKLSRSFSKEMSDLMKTEENSVESKSSSFCGEEMEQAPVAVKAYTPRVSWSPDDVNIAASNKSTPSVKVAAAPVSMRSIPIANQLRNTAYDISTKNLPGSATPSQPSSPTSSSDFFERSPPADFSCLYNMTPSQPSTNMVTPPNSSACLRIETTPSTGTPSKKTAAAPVSVRSTNKPPPIIVEHDQYSSINSSPRSGTPSPRAKVEFPRYSNVVILGSSSSKGKQKVEHATFEKWDSSSPTHANNRANAGILQSLYKQKDAFFNRNRKIDRSSSNSEHYLSSPSLASEDGDSFKSQFSPKGTSSPAYCWSPVKAPSRFDENMLKGTDSGGRKEIPLGLKALKKLSTGRKFSDDLVKAPSPVPSDLTLSPLDTSFKGSPRKTIATSVSSLWAFATEFPSVDKEDIERPKLNRISPDAIAGALARQGGKMTSPFHTNLFASFIPHISSGKTSSGTSEKSFCRTPVEDVRRSLPLSSRRRRSSAPSMGLEESEVDSDAESSASPGNRRGFRQKMAERAVSLPTISCDTSNQFHTTFISSLWDLSAEYSDYEKDKISRSSSRTPSQKSSIIRPPPNGNQ
jgi:hypothetical protein